MKFISSILPVVLFAANLVSSAPVSEPSSALEVRAPATKYHATLTGTVKIKDDEWLDRNDVVRSFALPASTVSVTALAPSKAFPVFKKCVGGEVRAELHAFAELDTLTDASKPRVQIRGQLKLYEGTHCNTGDLEIAHSITKFAVRPGKTGGQKVTLKSGAGDWAVFDMKAKVWTD